MWCAKEAALKALGTGLGLPLASVAVARLDPDTVVVNLDGAAADRARALHLANTLTGGWRRDGDYAVVWLALPAATTDDRRAS